MSNQDSDPFRDHLSSITKNGRSLWELFTDALNKLEPAKRHAVESKLRAEFETERAKAPRIAIIGKSGVGKTSTINALFATRLHVSHVIGGTVKPHEIAVDAGSVANRLKGKKIKGAKGDLLLYDMPGLGEDIDKDQEYKEHYAEVLARCDVAVWVMAAHERVIGHDQYLIREVVSAANPEVIERLVIGLNQVDLMQPGHWRDDGSNTPSQTQRTSINQKVEDVTKKLTRVVPGLTAGKVIPYSAKRRYHLEHLFNAMLAACPNPRAWVLDSRASIADYRELIDPQILAAALNSKEQ